MTQEALKLALEALKGLKSMYGGNGHKLHEINMIHRKHDTAITALEEALAQKQEPVKWSDYEPDGMHHNKPQKRPQNCGTGYCSCIECVMEPPQRTWVDVPDEEIKRLWIQYRAALPRYLCFAKALLSIAKEKNT